MYVPVPKWPGPPNERVPEVTLMSPACDTFAMTREVPLDDLVIVPWSERIGVLVSYGPPFCSMVPLPLRVKLPPEASL